MKKLFFVCVSVIMMTACTGNSTKQSCECNLCEACDSLLGSNHFKLWYDSLTTLIVEDLEYHYVVDTREQYINHIVEEYYHNPKIMQCFHEGYDGLCGDCYDEHQYEIDLFYDILDICDR